MLLPRNPITAINRLQPTSVQALFWVGATLLSATAFATEARATMANAGPLADIVVTATRIPERRIDLPASIDRLDARALREGQLGVNLSETLASVPGLSVQSRQNYAQDLQISVRGFGARSAFGTRGVRLYADGIPGTMPDGQGQFSHFDIGSAQRIEVLRGPFSALYGNSSGGVIAIFTEDGQAGVETTASAAVGSYGTERYALKGAGESGALNYVVDLAHFQTDGYRDHSRAERNNGNLKLRYSLSANTTLTLVGNAVETPEVQDPLGLTRSQLDSAPRQAGSNALAYNTRKSLRQQQVGATLESRLTAADTATLTLYDGRRQTTQYQAIPQASQASPTHPGGVVDLGRDYWGGDAHITDSRTPGGMPLRLSVGIAYDALDEARRGYLNFIGTDLGVTGALRRDDGNRVHSTDEYLQVEWDPTSRLRAMAGVRHSDIDIASRSRLTPNAPLSGVRYSATNPVAGVTFRVQPDLTLYGAYGRGFETPTLNDLAYRSTNGTLPGLNFALQPARSDNYEVGVKADEGTVRLDAAVFYIKTRNELAVKSSSGGRSVYENIGATDRRGAELGMDLRWEGGWTARLAYTHLRALTNAAYTACIGLPCVSSVVPRGSRLAAVPANTLYGSLTWRASDGGLWITGETVGRAQIYVDDRNSDAAAGYWATNLRAGLAQSRDGWKFTETLRLDNALDRRYVGSVIVNDSNGRFFEPAAGRTLYALFTAGYR